MYIVLVGNITEGYKAVGPFESFDDADEYTLASGYGKDTWIMELYSKENPNEAKETQGSVVR